MILPEIIRSGQPHHFIGNSILVSEGNSVSLIEADSFNKIGEIGYFDAGSVKNKISRIDVFKRIGRLGFHKLRPFQEGIIGIQRGHIVFKAKDSKRFNPVFSHFRGSRPLDFLIHPEKEIIYFGEYFGNENREEVYIYSSSDLKKWEKAWVFKKGEIRHVHGIVWDEYRKGIWVYTGDLDEESGIWFTDDDFKTLKKVTGGTQKARAVEIIPTQTGLILPMDSPLEQNYIYHYNVNTQEYENLSFLPGSAFHACISNGVYLISTVTEPSEVNKVNYASVFASLDGLNWKELYRFKKDLFPVKFQFITRYAEISFPSGINNSDYIIGYAQAVKKYGGKMIYWQK